MSSRAGLEVHPLLAGRLPGTRAPGPVPGPMPGREARMRGVHPLTAGQQERRWGRPGDGCVLEGQDDVAFLNEVPGWKKWEMRPRGTART